MGRRFSSAISWARRTFLQVMGNQAPAFTVASLDTTTTSRSWIVPIPVINSGGRCSSIFLVEPMGRPQAQLDKLGVRITQLRYALASRHLALVLLALECRDATSEVESRPPDSRRSLSVVRQWSSRRWNSSSRLSLLSRIVNSISLQSPAIISPSSHSHSFLRIWPGATIPAVKIRVLAFASAATAVGASEIELDLPADRRPGEPEEDAVTELS